VKKFMIIVVLFVFNLCAHPVSYSIDLEVSYNEKDKNAKILCTSNSRNKCGLYNFHLIDKNDKILITKKFPFLRKSTKVKIEKKPYKMIFFLRKTPEHTYNTIFE